MLCRIRIGEANVDAHTRSLVEYACGLPTKRTKLVEEEEIPVCPIHRRQPLEFLHVFHGRHRFAYVGIS